MTVELSVLAWSSVLLLVLILISANANLSAMGMAWGIGNREEASTASGWGARARRAYLNLLENLVIYGGLVVTAHLANVHTDLTILGAQLFMAGRIVHAIVYVAGITFLGIRTLAYFAGVIGTLLIAYELLIAPAK